MICDDPQARESARSLSQSEQREAILAGDITYMAGPDRPIGVVVPCTVIAQGDMADRMLDRKLYPEWQGEKTKMVASFPANEALWEEYAKTREESFLNGGQGEEVTEFDRQRRADMDAGAVVSWPERHFPAELSALQHAMNLKLLDEAAFYAEYQNEPLTGQEDELTIVTVEDIAAKAVNIARGCVPNEGTHLTAMIDISPNDILGREWRTEAGSIVKVELCLIDANWGQHPNVVTQFCRRSSFANISRPTHGIGITASRKPLNDPETRPKSGERRGLHWRIVRGKDAMRRVHFDTHFWKSFVFNRWAVPIGDSGSMTLSSGNAAAHRMFLEQTTAEYCVRTAIL